MTETLTERATADADLNALLPLVAQGDQRAFERFYTLTSSRAFGLVVRLVRDRPQAEEVLQEVFLEVWKASPQYSPQRGSAFGWLMTITHRKSVDRIRASQASRDRDLRIGIRDYEDEIESVEHEVEVTLESERVAIALGRLTELQQQAVKLSYFQGLTNGEIAAKLHVPVGTVKTRLRDGMIRLRDELEVNG